MIKVASPRMKLRRWWKMLKSSRRMMKQRLNGLREN